MATIGQEQWAFSDPQSSEASDWRADGHTVKVILVTKDAGWATTDMC